MSSEKTAHPEKWIRDSIFAVCMVFVAYFLNDQSDELNKLQSRDQQIDARVQSVEVRVAGNYVTRTELDGQFKELLEAVNRLEMAFAASGVSRQ